MEDNNYLKVLRHLAQFQGDGKMHEVEPLLRNDMTLREAHAVLRHLVDMGFMEKKGGHNSRSLTIIGNDGIQKYGGDRYYPLTGRITFKGVEYLKSTDNSTPMIVQNIQSHNAFVTANSPNSTFNANFEENLEARRAITEQINEIRETLENDRLISLDFKESAIAAFSQVLEEVEKEGKSQPQTRMKVLDWGSKISSIGSFTTNLIRLFEGIA